MLLQTSPFLRFDREWITDDLTLKVIPAADTLVDVLRRATAPTPRRALVTLAGRDEDVELLTRIGFLTDPKDIWSRTQVTMFEIETSTHCNWRCQFCPTGHDPKDNESMPLELFQEILRKAVEHGSVTDVTFNSFNEPTLDRHFIERVELLAKTKLRLRLHTNGSMLTGKKIGILAETGVLSFILFNIPALTELEFKSVTGSSGLQLTLDNMEAAIKAGLPVGVSIQGTLDELAAQQPLFLERYREIVEKPYSRVGTTRDRAGTLRNRYSENIRVDGTLRGCNMVLRWLHIGVKGDCFICSDDYHQREVFGNIRDGSLEKILTSPRAELVRKRVYGATEAPDDYICRTCSAMKRSVAREGRFVGCGQ